MSENEEILQFLKDMEKEIMLIEARERESKLDAWEEEEVEPYEQAYFIVTVRPINQIHHEVLLSSPSEVYALQSSLRSHYQTHVSAHYLGGVSKYVWTRGGFRRTLNHTGKHSEEYMEQYEHSTPGGSYLII